MEEEGKDNEGRNRVLVEKYLPLCVHPAAKVMPAVPEKMLPSETVPTSKVAAVPALQYTLLELAPPLRTTFRFVFILSVEAARKIQTASEMASASSKPASRVRFPEWTERES